MRDPRSTSPQIGGSGSFNHERTDTEPRIKDTTEELKPCPFCQSMNVRLTLGVGGRYAVECQECLALGPRPYVEDEAAEGWNRRRA